MRRKTRRKAQKRGQSAAQIDGQTSTVRVWRQDDLLDQGSNGIARFVCALQVSEVLDERTDPIPIGRRHRRMKPNRRRLKNMLETTVMKSTTAGVTGAKPTYFLFERYMPACAAEWAAFVAAVSAGSALPVVLDDGVAALAMAEAAWQSARTGQPVALESVLN